MKSNIQYQIEALDNIVKTLDFEEYDNLLQDIIYAFNNNHKLIISALGKNVPIAEKIVGTLNSVGLLSLFLNTSSAMHGDLGIIQPHDVVILMSKSGDTFETIQLFNHIKTWDINIWGLTFNKDSILSTNTKSLVLNLLHEGDIWNLIPNCSSIGFLLVMQSMTMDIINQLQISIEVFKKNHPGGDIGRILSNMEEDD